MDELAIKILGGVMRTVLAGAGGWLLSKGWADGATVDLVVGSSAALAAGAWSWAQKLWAQESKVQAVQVAAATGDVKAALEPAKVAEKAATK